MPSTSPIRRRIPSPVSIRRRAPHAEATADLLLVVGTSGVVYPAAGLPSLARSHGVPVVQIDPRETDLSDQVDHAWRTTAAVGLPALVDALRIGTDTPR